MKIVIDNKFRTSTVAYSKYYTYLGLLRRILYLVIEEVDHPGSKGAVSLQSIKEFLFLQEYSATVGSLRQTLWALIWSVGDPLLYVDVGESHSRVEARWQKMIFHEESGSSVCWICWDLQQMLSGHVGWFLRTEYPYYWDTSCAIFSTFEWWHTVLSSFAGGCLSLPFSKI